MHKKNYVANVIGDGFLDEELPVDRPEPRPIRAGDEGVLILYGDREGGTVVVAAFDEDDAARRLVATFGDDHAIDDLQWSTDQRPLSVAYTAGLVADWAFDVLRLDDQSRPYLAERVAEVEALVEKMPDEVAASYREKSAPHRALASLDALLDGVLARANERRYLVARFDVTDLAPDELDALVGEVTVQAEVSDEHPTVEVETEIVVATSETKVTA